MRRPAEFELIARYFAPMAGPGALGLLDDAAVITPPAGHDLVISKDMLAAGRHFFNSDPPDMIARKALRVNLSDLAAKGARPLGFLLGLALPADWTPQWLKAFARGLSQDAEAFRCPLLGGDTIRAADGLTLSITVFGVVPAGRMVKRRTVRPGDQLYVTGTIGDAALGLLLRLEPQAAWAAALSERHRRHLLKRYLLPEPRNALSGALVKCARAAMDISDGLIGDAAKMLRRGNGGLVINAADVPLSPAARAAVNANPARLETILTGGDDYEILAAIAPERCAAFERQAARAGIAVARIGEMTERPARAVILDAGGRPLRFARAAHDHFAGSA